MSELDSLLHQIDNEKNEYFKNDILQKIYSFIDLTNLNSTAKNSDIGQLCEQAISTQYKGIDIPTVAAVCVYPTYIALCREQVKDTSIKVASVSACFPHSQSFPEVKYLETEMAVEHGADEIDIVLDLNSFLNGKASIAFDEIKTIKQICGAKHLKVILEVSFLNDESLVHEASSLSMEAGADFIKTSTGKDGSLANVESAYYMCQAIAGFFKHTGKRIGFKAAGGISDTNTALYYYLIVKHILGEDWLNQSYFRIGASRLAGNLLKDITS